MDAVPVPGAFPKLLGQMRRQGGEQQQHCGHAFPPGGGVHGPVVGAVVPDAAQMVRQFHQGGDGGIELELVQVVVALADGLMQDALGGAHGVRVGRMGVQFAGVVSGQAPDPVEPAHHAVAALVAPGAALVPGADEHQKAAHGVGAHLPHHIVRVDHIAAAFAHLFVILPQDDALVEQPQKGFVDLQHSQIPQGFDKEAAVQQMHHGVFGAAGVLAHGHPFGGGLRLKGAVLIPGRAVAQHIPGRIHKGVHGVGFPASGAAAPGAAGIHEGVVDGQGRFAGGAELGVRRQQHGQFRFGRRLHAAVVAVHHRNRGSPVALPGNQPVAQPVGYGAPSPAAAFHIVGDGGYAFGVGHPVVGAAVGHKAGADIGRRRGAAVPLDGRNHRADGQAVFAGEVKIPRIVGRHAHYGAGSVGGQHIVGDVDGHAFVVQAVAGVGAGEYARLFLVGGQAVDFRGGAGPLNVGVHFLAAAIGGQLRHQRMFRRQGQEGDAKDGVNARGKGADFPGFQAVFRDVKGDFHAFAAPDPVALHGQDFVRPVRQAAEVQQFVGVVGDAEKPLLKIPPGDGGFAALADAVEHLFVGQHRLAGGAPHHGRFGAVGQPLFVELDKEPLVPAVVLRQAADHFPIPVVDGADGAQLPPHIVHIGHCPFVGMDAPGDGGVFGGQPEGVKPDGVEHIVALHPAEAGVGVRGGHGVPVADVQVP